MQEKTFKELIEFLQSSVNTLVDAVENGKDDLETLVLNVEDDLLEVKSFINDKEDK